MNFFLDILRSIMFIQLVGWILDTWILGALRSEEKQVPLFPLSHSSDISPTWSWLEMWNLGPHSQPAGSGSAFNRGSRSQVIRGHLKI